MYHKKTFIIFARIKIGVSYAKNEECRTAY